MLRIFSKIKKGFTMYLFYWREKRNSLFYKKDAGFTLVELLVVIAILGLLIAISVIAVSRYQRRAVDVRIQSSLAQIRNIAVMIYNDDVKYDSLCAQDNTLDQNHPRFASQLATIENDVKDFTNQYPICYASSIDYCVQSVLVASGNSFCIDAEGYIGTDETNCSDTNIKCSAP